MLRGIMRKHIVIFFGVALCAAVLLVFKATSNKDESVNYTPLISQETTRYGVSQFQQAIIDSNIERVEWCLDRGANVEHRIPSAYYLRCPQIMTHDAYENIEGFPPLHLAIYMGNAEIVKLLLKYSPDFESRITPFGYTPLLLAISLRNEKILSLLIEAGANVHATTGGLQCWEQRDKGYNALDIAKKYHSDNCIRIIKDYF